MTNKLKFPLIASGRHLYDSGNNLVMIVVPVNEAFPEGKTARDFAKWVAEAINTTKQNEEQQELG